MINLSTHLSHLDALFLKHNDGQENYWLGQRWCGEVLEMFYPQGKVEFDFKSLAETVKNLSISDQPSNVFLV